jgi:hypothetical protein
MKLVFLLLITFSGLNLYGQAKLSQEEYNVYKTILNVIYKENRETYSNQSHFVILQKTKTDSELDLDLIVNRKYKTLIKTFIRKNLVPAFVERNFPFKTYHLVKQKEIDDLFEKGEIEFNKRYEIEKKDERIVNPGGTTWMPFYEKFPEASGYYSLSRVAFDSNKVLAIAHVKREDIHSGFSYIYILRKEKDRWKIVASSGSVSAD